MEVEHIIPEAAGGQSVEANLWLSCSECNSYKSDRTESLDPETKVKATLFNPRTQIWSEHFEWTADGGGNSGGNTDW
jgi:5-methylcytosine-specific restriction endonuclease McrA